MPIFRLDQNYIDFPNPNLADENGIIAVGGDLSAARLVRAYQMGIFPWYNPDEPIIWWSPDPRSVIFPEAVNISRSMKKFIRRTKLEVTYDQAFMEVIERCGNTRERTWITDDIREAYQKLFEIGIAHSVEVWNDNKLVGGLYGISLGTAFFGESMFATENNASKLAFITLAEELRKRDFRIIDCQIHNSHLESLGAVEIPRLEFLSILSECLEHETLMGNWNDGFNKEEEKIIKTKL